MDLNEFLGYFDFSYDIVSPGGKYETRIRQERIDEGDIRPEDADKDLICLVDLQGAYLGDIGSERYPIEQASIARIMDRMDVYIHDMLIVDFEEVLIEYGVDPADMDLEQMVQKCKELGIEQGQVSYILADAVLNPDSVTLAELQKQEPRIDTPPLLTKAFVTNAIAKNESLTVEESDENGFLVWDEDDAKLIPFRFLENMSAQTVADQIYVSPDIPAKFQVDKALLADYLWNSCDRNTFMTLDEVVVIWSKPEDPENFDRPDFIDSGIKHLYEKFGDEYAYELGEGLLGQLWFERNTVIVNMGEIVRTAERIAHENSEFGSSYFSFENQTLVGFLTTAIHELRHLYMDTNIILPEDIYPLSLCSEEAVEAYCREAFENSRIQPEIMPNLFHHERIPLSDQIASAEVKAASASSENKQQAIKASDRNK